MDIVDLRYPIGRFQKETDISESRRNELIEGISVLPTDLRLAVAEMSPEQLDTPYRSGGWTVRQVVHHLADSHMNAFIRYRLALTEHEPTIKPYDEKLWADLPDSRSAPVELSLKLLECLHSRWTLMLRALPGEEFSKTFKHPALGLLTLDVQLSLYHWHGKHHLSQITALQTRMQWK